MRGVLSLAKNSCYQKASYKLEGTENHPGRTMTLTTVTIPLSRTRTYTVLSKKGCQLAHLKRKKKYCLGLCVKIGSYVQENSVCEAAWERQDLPLLALMTEKGAKSQKKCEQLLKLEKFGENSLWRLQINTGLLYLDFSPARSIWTSNLSLTLR